MLSPALDGQDQGVSACDYFHFKDAIYGSDISDSPGLRSSNVFAVVHLSRIFFKATLPPPTFLHCHLNFKNKLKGESKLAAG